MATATDALTADACSDMYTGVPFELAPWLDVDADVIVPRTHLPFSRLGKHRLVRANVYTRPPDADLQPDMITVDSTRHVLVYDERLQAKPFATPWRLEGHRGNKLTRSKLGVGPIAFSRGSHHDVMSSAYTPIVKVNTVTMQDRACAFNREYIRVYAYIDIDSRELAEGTTRPDPVLTDVTECVYGSRGVWRKGRCVVS